MTARKKKIGPCRWCGEPGIEHREVTPAIKKTKKVDGQLLSITTKAAIVEPVCKKHSAMIDRDRRITDLRAREAMIVRKIKKHRMDSNQADAALAHIRDQIHQIERAS